MVHASKALPIAAMWLAWLAYWIIAARGVKAIRRQESVGSRAAYGVPLTFGAILLASGRMPVHWLDGRFLPNSAALYWTGTVIVAAGLAFMVWARRHLGGNWSGNVTLKHDHELIRTGPYRLVRHPIYTGLLTAILGTAIAFGQWRDAVAFLFIAFGVAWKMKTEERLMGEIFPQDYARYRAEVPALIPFVRARRPPAREADARDEGDDHGKT
jgi:protein-S-isoprenylcysteine O-methyltransferase Ste14